MSPSRLDSAQVPLWCKTNFSFLEGASHPEELVERAVELGLPALAITDRDGVHGIVRAHTAAREHGLKLLVGSELTIAPDPNAADEQGPGRLVLLCRNRTGYANLCGLITQGRLRSAKGACSVTIDEVCARSEGLLALWLGDPIDPSPLVEAFGDSLFALITRHLVDEEVDRERQLRRVAEHHAIPVVAGQEVLYHVSQRHRLQDVLTCLRHNVSVYRAGRLIRPNAEHRLLAPGAFADRFADDPMAVRRTKEVADLCDFRLDAIRYVYPSEALPDGSTSMDWLRELTLEGARGRYGKHVPDRVIRQVEKELAVIDQLDYPGYFLTMHEIVRYCREQGILCQGRGSAANSAVCYCLGITAVDPVQMDLLFERFLSVERSEPPDIDLDIQHGRREEVIQHVYTKYGRDRAAMVANVIRFRTRSAIREVGKVLDLAPTAVDRLAKLASRSEASVDDWLSEAGLDPETPIHRQFVELVDEIRDFPRHLSIHPGGFLLGHEPIDTLVPIENAAMDGRTVIQWDKDDLETLGLFKVDLLALGSLTLCDEAFQLLRRHRGLDLDLARIPPEDQRTYDMICRGETIGVFQIESRAQMAMLPRLRPRTFYDLVVEISIVRPGPISGDMVHPYLRRRHGEEAISYPHKSLVPVLEKTLGVPLFQEQVMKLAVVAADYTPGEADQLRRDMAAWRQKGRIEQHRDRLMTRMQRKGIEPEFAERVFEQIRGFGEYGFPESHAASFALIAYATSWLRCHHREIFTCALLNAQPMGFYSPATILEDCKRGGVETRPIDVVHSDYECTLEPTGHADDPDRPLALRVGLRWLKGFSGASAQRLVDARRERPFASLEDFNRRARPDRDELEHLAAAGALRAFEPSRRDALWDVWARGREVEDPLPLSVHEPDLKFRELDPFESVVWDYETVGHSTDAHPMESFRERLNGQGFLPADRLTSRGHKRRARCAGLVICRQRPGTAKGVTFLTLEDETGLCNVVVWPDVFERHTALVKAEPLLAIDGKLQVQDGVTHLVAEKVWVPQLGERPPSGGSRDFH